MIVKLYPIIDLVVFIVQFFIINLLLGREQTVLNRVIEKDDSRGNQEENQYDVHGNVVDETDFLHGLYLCLALGVPLVQYAVDKCIDLLRDRAVEVLLHHQIVDRCQLLRLDRNPDEYFLQHSFHVYLYLVA